MEDYTVCVTDDSYFSYPDEKEIISIKQSLVSKPMKVSLDSLINSLDKSSKVVLLSQHKKEGHRVVFDYQDVVMLEITNTNHNYQKYTLEDAKENKFLKENAYFVAENKVSKRITNLVIAFKLTSGLRDKKEVESLYSKLFNLNSIFNSQLNLEKIRSNSLFLVNTNNAYVYNEDNKLDLNFSLKEKKDTKKAFLFTKKDLGVDTINLLPNKLSIQKKYLTVNTLFSKHEFNSIKSVLLSKGYNFKGNKFSNLTSLREFILENITITDLFGVSKNVKFNSIFEFSRSEEATDNIVINDKGIELYFGDIGTTTFKGDLIRVVEKLTGYGTFETLVVLANLLDIEIGLDSDALKIKKQYMKLIEVIKDPKLIRKCPKFYQVIHTNIELFEAIIIGILESPMYDWEKDTWLFMSFKPLDKIAVECSEYLGKQSKSRSTISRIINLMSILDIIDKKPDADIPLWLLEMLSVNKEKKHYKQRVEVMELSLKSHDFLNKLEALSEYLLDRKFTTSLLSYDYVLLTLGKDIADKVYIQKTEAEKILSDKAEYIRKIAAKYFSHQLDTYGYVEESKIRNILTKNIKRNKKGLNLTSTEIKTEVKKLSNSFYDSDGVVIKKVPLTKELRADLNITDIKETKRPKIFMR